MLKYRYTLLEGGIILNIAFFIKPKLEVVYLKDSDTLEDGLEILKEHKFTSIPIIDGKGRYIDSISEGDVLWYLRDLMNSDDSTDLNDKMKTIKMSQVPRFRKNSPVRINSDMENLISMSICQNFVPVVDDDNVFIGIITRSSIINYCFSTMKQKIMA